MLPGLSVNMGVRAIAHQGDAIAKSAARLSSGLRIRNAADDAGGIGVSEALRAKQRGLRQAAHNISDAMNFLRIGLDGLTVVNDVLQRMRELAVQARNGTVSATEQTSIQAEWTECVNALTQARAVAAQARLDFSLPFGLRQVTLQVGADNGETLVVSYENLRTAVVTSIATLTLTAPNAATSITAVDTSIDSIVAQECDLGAIYNRLEKMLDSTMQTIEEISSAESRIRDADMADEMTALTRANVLQSSAVSVTKMHNISRAAAQQLLGA